MLNRILATVLSLGFAGVSLAADSAKPNLLVIQTDEHNFRTLGCYRALMSKEQAFIWGDGVSLDTPNLDWIAKNGAIADRAYATSPVCTPSRASLVSGLYPQTTGAIGNNLKLKDDIVTYAEALKRAGYSTGYAGKWHLEGDGKPQWGPDRKFGFDDNRFMFNRGHWKKLELTEQGPKVAATNAQGVESYDLAGADAKTFTTDFLTDRAIDFIQQHKRAPFVYHLSIPDPHGPNTVRAPYDTMYVKQQFRQPLSAQSPGQHLPSYASTARGKFDALLMARYFGMVKCVDDNVGRLLTTLREAGLLERTFIVFTSDHGDLCGEHGRDNKGVPMEGSARVPFLLYAPGKVAGGTVVKQAIGGVDFKPTILTLMDVKDPTPVEGRDVSKLFTDPSAAKDWHDVSFVRIGKDNAGWLGAFSRQYKLVVSPGAPPALFDLEADSNELTNVFTSPAQREVVRKLATELKSYAQKYKDPHLASTAVQADLEWAISGGGEYVAAKRDGSAKSVEEDEDAPPKGEPKAPAKTRAKGK